jgi:hydroxypyruvate reductase
VEDYQKVTRLLLESGAAIQEINIIRQGLDQFKGGGLVRLLSPASIITLILSDVVGDPLDIIASGPTVTPACDAVTAGQILEKYDLIEKIPASVRKCLLEEKIPEEKPTPYSDGESERTIENIMIRNNVSAVQAACDAAEEHGFKPRIMDTRLQGEASDIGWKLGSFLREEWGKRKNPEDKLCWIYGGETTVTIHGEGKGGRNQELALSAARAIAGLPKAAILSIATDGEDGPTDAAGAFVTGETIARGEREDLDVEVYLQNNNTYPYLDRVGGLVKTGPSGTNVNDLVILFAY